MDGGKAFIEFRDRLLRAAEHEGPGGGARPAGEFWEEDFPELRRARDETREK